MRNLRPGVTIMEVLFATMITTIGLLAALTLLPVAASQAQKARTSDSSTTGATAAVGFFDARGMRKPQIWIAYNWGTGQPVFPWFEFQNNVTTWFDGSESFCFDPRMIAANLQSGPTPAQMPPSLVVDTSYTPSRAPASTFPRGADARPLAMLPYMRRLSLASGLTGQPLPPQVPARAPVPPPLPMTSLLADSVFVFDDDLNYDRAADASLVASQTIDFLPALATTPARRQREGHLSWMATLTPKLERYVGLTIQNSPLVQNYVLSIVVFHDRPATLAASADPLNERVLNVVDMPGGGVTGGEVLLQTAGNPADAEEAEEFLDIHPGEWIMLMGTLPSVQIGLDPSTGNPVNTDPLHVFKWYRVSDLEAEVTWPGPGNPAQRFVTLVGQDWHTNTGITGTNFVAQAVAMEGVVAVVEKTIRLEP